jgi:integrative and conjugative element protein (TIGR02256 family)
MIVYPIGGSGQRLIFSQKVVNHFTAYQQKRCWQREAGGQLFARFGGDEITIEEATGPRWNDGRTRYAYRPNRSAEQREIEERHVRGLHFVGDWHTHPEQIPTPSIQDIQSMSEMFVKSKHGLNGFVLAIVGSSGLPAGLFIAIVGRSGHTALAASYEETSDADLKRLPLIHH